MGTKFEYYWENCFCCNKQTKARWDRKQDPWCKECFDGCIAANLSKEDYVVGRHVFFKCRECGERSKTSKRRFMGTQFCGRCDRVWWSQYKKKHPEYFKKKEKTS